MRPFFFGRGGRGGGSKRGRAGARYTQRAVSWSAQAIGRYTKEAVSHESQSNREQTVCDSLRVVSNAHTKASSPAKRDAPISCCSLRPSSCTAPKGGCCACRFTYIQMQGQKCIRTGVKDLLLLCCKRANDTHLCGIWCRNPDRLWWWRGRQNRVQGRFNSTP